MNRVKQILLVDDSHASNQLTKKIFERLGFAEKIAIATNGKDAIDMMGTMVPDVAFLDINMPIMNGFEVLDYVKSDERFKDTKFIVLTSSSLPEDKHKAERFGAVLFKKPLKISNLTSLWNGLWND
ncbi:MAG: response regulator [Flavobacteriales bacterium]|nr:response regulator [Flavobacteriales bacterium]